MSTQITTSFVEQYSANVQALVQQRGSKLRGLVLSESIRGKTAFFDQIGSVAAVKKTSRHADTPQMNTPHARRRLTTDTYNWSDLIDNDDKIKMLTDPASEYAQAAAWAMGRAIDEVIIDGALGAADTGENGTIPVALPDSQKVVHGSTGMSLDKLSETKRLMDESDCPAEDRYIVLTAKQMQDMLKTEKMTSADYASVKALIRGEITEFMGFKFVQVNGKRGDNSLIVPAFKDSTKTIRKCLAFQKNGIRLGIGQDPFGKITERDDKCFATQVYYEMTIGAARMQEELVVEVQCQE
nr:MAG TPA: major capsid protein [Caudoviricetes sp.]